MFIVSSIANVINLDCEFYLQKKIEIIVFSYVVHDQFLITKYSYLKKLIPIESQKLIKMRNCVIKNALLKNNKE